MADWRTVIDPAITAAFGAGDLHVAIFQPTCDRAGPRDAVVMMIPEASRPEVAAALNAAAAWQARVVFVCDTRRQADEIADYAARRLPRHRRIAYERAAAGGWGTEQ